MDHALIGRIRVLERALVLERAEAAVPPIVDRFVDQWDPATTYYELELPRRLAMAGFHLPTSYRSITYLEQCRRDNTPPDPDHLIHILLPWTT